MEDEKNTPVVVDETTQESPDMGALEFVAATSETNLNGWTYNLEEIYAYDKNGEKQRIDSEGVAIDIPLLRDHKSDTDNILGRVTFAKIENGKLIANAVFAEDEQSQKIREEIKSGKINGFSIGTSGGEEDESGEVSGAIITEISVVAEPADQSARTRRVSAVLSTPLKTENNYNKEEEENEKMAIQKRENTAEKTVDKKVIREEFAKLINSGEIRKLSREQIKNKIENAITFDGATAYTIPEAVFSEIIAAYKPTGIFATLNPLSVDSFTSMVEDYSDEDVARAGKWKKGDTKITQALNLLKKPIQSEHIYKMQEISYADLDSPYANVIVNFVNTELPEKLEREVERAFLTGDGRLTENGRKVTSIISIEEAAANPSDLTVTNLTDVEKSIAGLATAYANIEDEGEIYLAINKKDLAIIAGASFWTNGLIMSKKEVADRLGYAGIFTPNYIPEGTAYVYNASYARFVGGQNQNGERIEAYDIDVNARKVEYIRRIGGRLVGLKSGVKITFNAALGTPVV